VAISSAEIEKVAKASSYAKAESAARLGRLVSFMEGRTHFASMSPEEYDYCMKARVFVKAFVSVENPIRSDLSRTLLCCTTTGESLALDTAVCEGVPTSCGMLGGGSVSREFQQAALERLGKQFEGMQAYQRWNLPIMCGISGGSAWRGATKVMAFSDDVWRFLEEGVEGWMGAEDIPAKVAAKLHSAGVCSRYDVNYPANILRLYTLVVATPVAGSAGDPRCGNPACGGVATPGAARHMRCSGCTNISYCSRVCQTAHWKVHKRLCVPLGKAAAKTLVLQ
jgi:hypothetical protein